MGVEGPGIFKATILSFVQKNVKKNMMTVTGLDSSEHSVASIPAFST